jgi:hypothetical protein
MKRKQKKKYDVYENCNLKRLALVAENVKNSEAGVFTLPCLYIILNVRNDDAVTCPTATYGDFTLSCLHEVGYRWNLCSRIKSTS